MVEKEQKTSEAEIQQMYMQLQQIDEQTRQLAQEAQAVEQRRAEFLKLAEQLDSVKTSKKGSHILSNLGAGIFTQAKLENSNEFVVNVGAGTFVKKSLADVRKSLENQAKELEKVQQQITQNLQMLAIQSQIIQAQMQKGLGLN